MTTRTAAPRLAVRLLGAVLPSTVGGRSTLGDLLEDYHRRPRGLRRRLWFWAETLDLTRRYLPARTAGFVASVGGDLVYSIRVARRTPGLTLATLITLGLAIGASTAAFSVANGSWLRQLLATDPSIVATWRMRANGGSRTWPAAELLALRGRTTRSTIEGAAMQTLPVGATRGRETDARVLFVTGTYHETFRVDVSRGRRIDAPDDASGAAPVAVVDHLYWRRALGGDHGVIGQTLWIRDSPFTIVGIASRDVVDPSQTSPNVWVPLSALPAERPALMMIRRLTANASAAQSDAELTSLLPAVAGLAVGAARATRAESGPVFSADFVAGNRLVILGGLAIIVLVLVLACANVSNLQLAGAAARERELAIRRSCGASQWRVLRQLATESAAVSVVAGGFAFVIARLCAPVMAIGMSVPDADVDLDLRTYAFAFVLTMIAAAATALAPALQGRHEISVRSGRVRSSFLGVQAAASIVIVALSALVVRTVFHLTWMGPGYDVDRLVNITVPFPHDERGQAGAADFWRATIERVRAMPGVESASLALAPPFGISVGDPEQLVDNPTDDAYFETIGMRIVSGRTYTAAEVVSRAPVAVISEEIARRFWPNEDPVGSSAGRIDQKYSKYQVIGVVGDAMALRVHTRGAAAIYRPGVWPDWVKLTVRTANPSAMSLAIRDAVRAVSPNLQPNVQVVADRFERELRTPHRNAGLAIVIALLTVTLSVVGLSGVTMFSVQARTREIGVRLALGARSSEVLAMLLRDGLRAVVIGLAIGLGLAMLAGRYVASLLYGMSEHDPIALTGAVILLLGAAIAAVLVPTRRAARLDPAVVLREG